MKLKKLYFKTIEIEELPDSEFIESFLQLSKGKQVFYYSLSFNGITIVVGGGTPSEPLVLINTFFKTFDEVSMYLELTILREEKP